MLGMLRKIMISANSEKALKYLIMFHNVRQCSTMFQNVQQSQAMLNNSTCFLITPFHWTTFGDVQCLTIFYTLPLLFLLPLQTCSDIFDNLCQCSWHLSPNLPAPSWGRLGYVRWCLTMLDSDRKWSTMLDNVRQYLAMFDNVRQYQAKFDNIWQCWSMFVNAPQCLLMFVNVRPCSTIYPYSFCFPQRYVWICSTMFGNVWHLRPNLAAHPLGNKFGYLWRCSTTFHTWSLEIPFGMLVNVRQWSTMFNWCALILSNLPFE